VELLVNISAIRIFSMCLSVKFFFKKKTSGGITPNFDLKNVISTYTKEFYLKKNGPNSSNFEGKKIPNRQIFMISL